MQIKRVDVPLFCGVQRNKISFSLIKRKIIWDFPGGRVVKDRNLPWNAGVCGSNAESLGYIWIDLCTPQLERSPHTAAKLPQPNK